MPGVLLDKMSSPLSDTVEDSALANNRRSGRVSKKPNFLSEQPSTSNRKRAAPHDEDEDMDADSSEDDDETDEGEPDEPAEEELRAERKSKSKSAPKRPAPKKARTNGAVQMPIRSTAQKSRQSKKKSTTAPVSSDDSGTLYAEIFSGDKTVEEVVGEWAQRFTEHESRSLAEIINFVLKCCGCQAEVTHYDIEDVDGAANKLGDLQEEFQAQEVTDYPLIARNKFATVLREGLSDFFSMLVKTIDATDVLVTNVELIENVEVWLSSMSAAQNRPFRHTATVASLAIITALCEVGRDLAAAAATAQRQSENINKGKGANKKRASRLLQNVKEAQQKQAVIDTLLKDWVETIFIHRYRDVEAKIRVECAEALGGWITTYPDLFFDAQHLRYLGWVLSDINPTARHEVLRQLVKLYRNRDRLPGLKVFTERFRERIVEMATLDSELSVRVLAMELLVLLRDAEFLEPDDIDAVGRLIFDADPRVRKSVVPFFSASVDETFESKLEDLGGIDAINEELEDAVDNTDGPGLPWLRLKSLAEVLAAYDALDPEVSKAGVKGAGGNYRLHAEELETRFVIVGQSLYPTLDSIHHWETMANYLLFDSSERRRNGVAEGIDSQLRDSCKLTEREEYILLELLNVAIRRHVLEIAEATADKKSKKTKKQKDDLADQQDSAARTITTLIPQLLKRFGESPTTALPVLRLERVVGADGSLDFQQDPSTYKHLLDDIDQQFKTHGDEEVLTEASRALLRAKTYQDLGDVTDEKIDEMWEQTIQAFRQLTGKKDPSVRGSLKANVLDGLVKTVYRLERLSGISSPVSHFEASVKQSRKSGEEQPLLQILTTTIRRAIAGPDVRGDASTAASEDALAVHAAQTVGVYFLWTVAALTTAITDGSLTDAHLDAVTNSRDAFVNNLDAVLESRSPSDPVSSEIASILLDTHTSFATLRQLQPRNSSNTDYLYLAQDISPELQSRLLKVFTATERRFAHKTGKNIEKPREDKPKRPKSKKAAKKTDDIAFDAEPMDEDALEASPAASEDEAEEQDSDTPPSLVSDDSEAESEDENEGEADADARVARKEAQRLHSALLAEKSLCEFGSKLVLASVAGVMELKVVRKRLELNKAKLGPNWREVCRYFEQLTSGPKKGKVAAGAVGSGDGGVKKVGQQTKEVKKSQAIVVESESEDDEEEEVEDEDGEEMEREEIEQEAEVESVLGD